MIGGKANHKTPFKTGQHEMKQEENSHTKMDIVFLFLFPFLMK